HFRDGSSVRADLRSRSRLLPGESFGDPSLRPDQPPAKPDEPSTFRAVLRLLPRGTFMTQMQLAFPLCSLLFSPPMGPYAQPPLSTDPEIEVTKVAEGIYGVLRAQHPDEQPGHSNSLIIINDEDVVVVDATRMPSQARKILGVVRSLTDKP